MKTCDCENCPLSWEDRGYDDYDCGCAIYDDLYGYKLICHFPIFIKHIIRKIKNNREQKLLAHQYDDICEWCEKQERNARNMGYEKLPEGSNFDTKYATYIIAFCPDTDSWFVTNERFFFYEYGKEFQTKEDGITFFKDNPKIFYDKEIRMGAYRPSFRENVVWLDDMNELIKI